MHSSLELCAPKGGFNDSRWDPLHLSMIQNGVWSMQGTIARRIRNISKRYWYCSTIAGLKQEHHMHGLSESQLSVSSVLYRPKWGLVATLMIGTCTVQHNQVACSKATAKSVTRNNVRLVGEVGHRSWNIHMVQPQHWIINNEHTTILEKLATSWLVRSYLATTLMWYLTKWVISWP